MNMVKTVIAVYSSTIAPGRRRRKEMRDYRKELKDIITKTDEAKSSLADLVLYLDSEDKDVDSLDEALEALDDVIDILEDYVEEI